MRFKRLLLLFMLLALVNSTSFAESETTGGTVQSSVSEITEEIITEEQEEMTDSSLLTQKQHPKQYVIYYQFANDEFNFRPLQEVEQALEVRYNGDVILWSSKNTSLNQDDMKFDQSNSSVTQLMSDKIRDYLIALQEPAEIWLLMPGDASVKSEVLNLSELQGEDSTGLLSNLNISIHLVVAGNALTDGVSKLIEGVKKLERCTITYLPTGNKSEKIDDGMISMDHFFMSLYGIHVGLELTEATEQKGKNESVYTFQTDGTGDLILIAESTMQSAVAIAEIDGRDVSNENQKVEAAPGKTKSTHYALLTKKELSAGEHNVKISWKNTNGSDISIVAALYPFTDEETNPFILECDKGEGNEWLHNEQTVVLSAGDLSWLLNQECVSTTLVWEWLEDNEWKTDGEELLEANSDGIFERVLSVEDVKKSNKHRFTAKIVLKAVDNTVIACWETESGEIIVSDTEITKKNNEEKSQVEQLLIYGDNHEKRSYKWNELFDYNSNDDITLGVVCNNEDIQLTQDTLFEENAIVRPNGDGDGFQVELTQAAEEKKLTVYAENKKGRALFDVTFTAIDVSTVWEHVDFAITDPQSTDPQLSISANGEIKGLVTIPAEWAKLWNDAVDRLKLSLSKMNTIKLKQTTGTNEQQFTGQTNEDESVTIPWNYAVDSTLSEGTTFSIKVQLLLADQQIEGKENTYEFIVTNTDPSITEEYNKEYNEIIAVPLQGYLWNYEPAKDILNTLVGTNDLYKVFTDKETPQALNFTVKVDDEQKAVTENGICQASAQDDAHSVFTFFTGKQEHTLKLYVNDGSATSDHPEPSIEITFVLDYAWDFYFAMFLIGLAAVIVLIILILIIVAILKPSFKGTTVKCAVVNGYDSHAGGIMVPVNMSRKGKKPILLSELLIMACQPVLPDEGQMQAEKIKIYPAKRNRIRVQVGKEVARSLQLTRKEAKRFIGTDDVGSIKLTNCIVLMQVDEQN